MVTSPWANEEAAAAMDSCLRYRSEIWGEHLILLQARFFHISLYKYLFNQFFDQMFIWSDRADSHSMRCSAWTMRPMRVFPTGFSQGWRALAPLENTASAAKSLESQRCINWYSLNLSTRPFQNSSATVFVKLSPFVASVHTSSNIQYCNFSLEDYSQKHDRRNQNILKHRESVHKTWAHTKTDYLQRKVILFLPTTECRKEGC